MSSTSVSTRHPRLFSVSKCIFAPEPPAPAGVLAGVIGGGTFVVVWPGHEHTEPPHPLVLLLCARRNGNSHPITARRRGDHDRYTAMNGHIQR